MKIAFDLHGVIEKYPEEFRAIIELLEWMKVEIWLISGPPIYQIERELNEIGFGEFGIGYFTGIASIVDFLKSDPSVEMRQDEHGNWWTDDYHWWSSKAKICAANKIDVLIDDSIQYKEYFGVDHNTKFVLLKDMEFERLRDCIINAFISQAE